MNYQLRKLENKSLGIIREAKDKFKNLAVLQSGSKESKVCLNLCKRAFFGKIPFAILQLSGIDEIKKAIKDNNLEALIVSTEILDSVADFGNSSCLRICPLLDWSELDIWLYIKENNIQVDQNVDEIIERLQLNQSSGSKDGGRNEEKEEIMQRLRSLGYR